MKVKDTIIQRQRCGCASVVVSTDGMAHCDLKAALASVPLVRVNKGILNARMVFWRSSPRKPVIVKRR